MTVLVMLQWADMASEIDSRFDRAKVFIPRQADLNASPSQMSKGIGYRQLT